MSWNSVQFLQFPNDRINSFPNMKHWISNWTATSRNTSELLRFHVFKNLSYIMCFFWDTWQKVERSLLCTKVETLDNNEQLENPEGEYKMFSIEISYIWCVQRTPFFFQTHIGDNIWISTGMYNKIKLSKKDSIFVKVLPRCIFPREELQNSTVTGRFSNRSKENQI